MTQPDEPPTSAAAQLTVQVGAGVIAGPDGLPWVQLQIGAGSTAFALVMPENLAAQLGPVFADALAQGAANARKARLGVPNLIVPGGVQLPPPNGTPQ